MTREEWQSWLDERQLFDAAWAAALSVTLARTQWFAMGIRQLDLERAHAVIEKYGVLLRGRTKC